VRAVRCVEGAPTVLDVPAPQGPGVELEVVTAGICGSDLHLMQWNLPFVAGHEFAARLRDGTLVVAEPIAPCRECDRCRLGDYNLCERGPAMVMGVGREGVMAERCVVPADALVRLPAGTVAKDASLVEPLAVGVHGVRRGGIRAGERVAVVGGGSLGQLALVAAQAVGAPVDLEARHEHQREAAARLGAGRVEGEYAVVIEAAGSQSALHRAVEVCRPGGRIVLLGTYWDGLNLPAQSIALREIDLIPSSMYARSGPSRDFDVAAAILAHRPEVGPAVITHRFPLDAAAEAFAAASDRSSGAIKVVLEP